MVIVYASNAVMIKEQATMLHSATALPFSAFDDG
jgi:hypothetical protein